MTLLDNTLFGEVDKVGVAIERLRAFEPLDGYYVAFSGGKRQPGNPRLVPTRRREARHALLAGNGAA